jgi:hypothetical protein
MIENVDKLRIYIIVDLACFKKQDLRELKKGILNENFNYMIHFIKGKISFFVYIREKHNKPVGFAGISFSEESVVLIDLEGYISPENIQKIIEGKMNMGALNQLYDISKQTQKK